VSLTDEAGEVVMTVNTTVSGSGVQRIDLGADTANLPPGRYTLSVAVRGAEEGVVARPLSSGVVEGVRWGTAGPVLVVGEQEVPLSNVLEITT
jgi:flagellar hook assembly protein FlgD